MEAILIRGGTIDVNKWSQYCLVREIARFSERHAWRDFDQSHARISRWGITSLTFNLQFNSLLFQESYRVKEEEIFLESPLGILDFLGAHVFLPDLERFPLAKRVEDRHLCSTVLRRWKLHFPRYHLVKVSWKSVQPFPRTVVRYFCDGLKKQKKQKNQL